jgi:hypothetical protein
MANMGTSKGFLRQVCLAFIFAAPTIAAEPCCKITTIDPSTGLVTALEPATERLVTFRVVGRPLLQRLKPGKPIFVNFKTLQVFLDEQRPCCAILRLSALGQTPATSSQKQSPNTRHNDSGKPK